MDRAARYLAQRDGAGIERLCSIGGEKAVSVLIPTSDTEGVVIEVDGEKMKSILRKLEQFLAQRGDVSESELPFWRVKGQPEGKL